MHPARGNISSSYQKSPVTFHNQRPSNTPTAVSVANTSSSGISFKTSQWESRTFSARPNSIGSESKSEISDVDVFKQLIELQSWKEMLDSQPPEMKQRIWSFLDGCGQLSNVDFNSFSNTINKWAQDIVPNMNVISSLHTVVSRMISPDQSNHFNKTRDHYHNLSRNDRPGNGTTNPAMKEQNFASSSLPRISMLESRNSNVHNGTNDRFTMPTLANGNPQNQRNQLNMYSSSSPASRKLPSLPPLQASFSSNSNSPLHTNFPATQNANSLQKRKEYLFEGEPQTKRMKMDFLNS